MGATVGGPILKDRLFGYGAIDVLRSSSISSGVTTVETQDFANYVEANYDNIASKLLKIGPPLTYPTTNTLTVAQLETEFPGYFPAPANIPANLDAIGPLHPGVEGQPGGFVLVRHLAEVIPGSSVNMTASMERLYALQSRSHQPEFDQPWAAHTPNLLSS